MQLNLEGLVAAPHTPMHADGALNLDAVAAQGRWLAHSGVVGVFLGGTTGEWCSLTTEERIGLQSAWAKAGGDLVKIAHVGHNCQRDAITLAEHAASVKLDAVSAVAPSFLKPGSAEDIADYFLPIAAAAPKLPFYIYHIPGLSGVTVDPASQIESCLRAIPNFAGVKFTDPDLFAFARCMKRFGTRCELMWGVDEILLGALPYGAKSAVGSTYNYAAPLFNAMISAYRNGDHAAARRQGEKAIGLVELLIEYGVLAAGKSLMAARGVECGPARPPIAPLSEAKRQELCKRAGEAGYLDPVSEVVIVNRSNRKEAAGL